MELRPIEIFCCAVKKDQPYLKKIGQQLGPSVKRGTIVLWDESMILGGEIRNQEIEKHLESASIFLLLISAEFLVDEYCYELVTKKALARQVAGNATVIPVIVRQSDWQTTELQHLQPIPHDLRPITAHDRSEQDDLIAQVATAITTTIQRLSNKPSPLASTRMSIIPSGANIPIPAVESPSAPVPPMPPTISPSISDSPNPAASPSPLGPLDSYPPIRPKKGIKPLLNSPLRLIILFVVLVVVVGASILGGIALYTNQQNQIHAQATATAQAQVNITATTQAQTQATSTAQAQATATVLAQVNATATATASVTVVSITSPTDGSTVDMVTTVQGTASNIPKDEELWILLVPATVNAYYPQPGPVVITGNTWSSIATVGVPSDHGLGFTLIVALADQNGSAAIKAYLKQANSTGVYQGLPSLPDGVVPQSQIHVVRK